MKPEDMRCPEIPDEGDNFWEESCIKRQEPDHEEDMAFLQATSGCLYCEVGRSIRKKRGLEPPRDRKFICECGKTSLYLSELVRLEIDEPRCMECASDLLKRRAANREWRRKKRK